MTYWHCEPCSRSFQDLKALRQHLRDSPYEHPSCEYCDELFGSSEALTRHYDRRHYYCYDCDEAFDDEDELADHKEDEHFYCRECDRLFIAQANLDAHLASSLHTPRSFECPASSCERMFVSTSAVILHLESGTCPSGFTWRRVDNEMAKIDGRNIIVVCNRYWATDQEWNGSGYECFLCNDEFCSLQALNQHLRSPRHFRVKYRCPEEDCNAEFTYLSALCQHVERKVCGARAIKIVRKVVGRLNRRVKYVTE